MRAHLLVTLALLALAAATLAPGAGAQVHEPGSRVDITRVTVPDTIVADRAFAITVELENKQSTSQRVLLFVAAYEPEDGSPCGSAASPRFRGFVHRVQPSITLAPNEATRYPLRDTDLPWHQVVNLSVMRRDGPLELCVFAANTESSAGATLTYFDYESLVVTGRLVNQPPTGEWSWTPRAPIATELVSFRANGTDEEGDPLTYHWDFGHHNASGRARAEGATARHLFYPEGTYAVTLTIRDPWDAFVIARDLTVLPEPERGGPTPTPPDAEPEAWWRVPAPGVALALAAVASAAVLTRRLR